MRRLVPMLPHALASIAIVVLSVVAIGLTAGDIRALREPTASAAIAPPQLSTAGRLAYWRPSPGDDLELWVSDLGGSRRFPIASAKKDADVDLTRWSPDGSAVAWTADGEVHVVRLDRTRTTVSLPAELRESRWRPTSLEWSPSSTRIAATLRAVYGVANEGDVFIADLDRAATTWARRTTSGDTYAGPWLDDERILIETTSATIGVVGASGSAAPRPLTAMPAVSPRIGPDGRLYFFGGRNRGPALFSGPLAAGSVWSMTIDGEDHRREAKAERDQGRLAGFLGDGRFIVGVPGALYVAGDDAVLFPWRTGAVRRVVTSQDGRSVIGLTETRIVRADLAKIPRAAGGGDPPADATAVVLDGVRSADAWFPSRPAALVRSASSAGDGLRETLTFTFGRSILQLRPGGEVRPLVSAPTLGWIGPVVPAPTGDRIATTISSPRASDGRYEPTTVVLDRQGTRIASLGGSPTRSSWSLDGAQLALSLWSDAGGYSLQLYDAATWTPGRRFERSRGAWSAAGLVLIDDGRPHPALRGQPNWVRIGQSIDLVTNGERRRITDADRLARHPLLARTAAPDVYPAISDVTPSHSGAHLLVSLSWMGADGRNNGGGLAIVRARDGEPLAVLRTDPPVGLGDLAWSPSGDLLGATRSVMGLPGPPNGTAVVFDVTGRAILERDGRFAGWSADGERLYVARREGLFVMRRDGSEEERISALGVAPVVATPP